jgi:hypothetical protein
MARIGYVEYQPAGIKLPITFTERKGRFTCTYAGTPYEHTDVGALRALVLDAIKAAYQLTWTPVIVLQFIATPNGRASSLAYSYLNLTRERIYIGHHPSLGYKQVHWTAQEEKRLEVSRALLDWGNEEPFTLPAQHESYDGKTSLYFPYSEELWATLEEIQSYLRIATNKLSALLQTPESIATLKSICHTLFDTVTTQSEKDEDPTAL